MVHYQKAEMFLSYSRALIQLIHLTLNLAIKSIMTENKHCINPFHATRLFLFPLKTLENLWFSDVFRGV